MRSCLLVLAPIAAIALLHGCSEAHTPALPDEVDPLTTCGATAGCERVVEGTDQVDLLFMIENAGAISEEQISIVTEIPRIIRILTSGDRTEPPDGIADFRPARSLHIGIVSSDMGTGSVSGIESCSAGFGDDGIMINRGSAGTGCMDVYPSAIFDFEDGRDDWSAFSTAVGCTAALGTAGCGFEHQLEAPLKALSLAPTPDGTSPVSWTRPGYRPPLFLGNTFGHGGPGGANDTFMRERSLLAILIATIEEDCSAHDPTIFDRTNPMYSSVDLNLRCHMFPEAQYPVQRYVDGFIGLRSRPELLVFGVIAGVPQTAVEAGLGYDAILALPEMEERIDPDLHNRLLPSCISPGGRGVAYAPRRIVQVAAGLERLGARTFVESVCNTSFTGAFDTLIARLSEGLSASCLARPHDVDADGNIACDVYVALPPIDGPAEFQHCADLPEADAYTFVTERVEIALGAEERREICRVRQVGSAGAGTEAGWFYDDGSSPASTLGIGCSQQIAMSVIRPQAGAELLLVCPDSGGT